MKLRVCVLPLMISGAVFASEPLTLDTGSGLLHGTLELPASKPPFAIALIIAGSGPTDRDGNSAVIKGKNDSLKLLAQALAARGIGSLRYDKRAIAESQPAAVKEADLRFDTFVDDAVKWGEFLRKDGRCRSLAIIGHSEGSLIGMISAQRLLANGFVSIAGPGVPGGQKLLEQLRARKLPPDLAKQTESIVKSLEEGHTVEPTPPALAALFRPSVQPYLISWFKYDPAREIAKLRMPVLILQGTTDVQVSVKDAQALAAANPGAKLVLIDGMNHVLKEVPADHEKQLASYGDAALPVVPKLVDEIANLINNSKAQK